MILQWKLKLTKMIGAFHGDFEGIFLAILTIIKKGLMFDILQQ